MERKIFLEKNRGLISTNVERKIDVGLSTKTRLLPNHNLMDNFSLYKQYNKERDECSKFRVILNVNPICSNVLYNARTEIVINEGSSGCTLLIGDKSLSKSTYAPNATNTITSIKYMDAIRNTEYSHKANGGFVYHCGADIFNNHMLRKTGFVHVNKLNDSNDNGKNYNTIFDYSRNGEGKIIEQEIGVKYNNTSKTKMHLYQFDTIMTLSNAYLDNCVEKDGWWGFTNPNTIEINNSDDSTKSINRMMANNKACEFIDFYPDRSLYSFIPKYNKFKNRIEKNWDYCLTYPYKKNLELINTICEGEKETIKAYIKRTINGNGQPMVECSSLFKHTFKRGDYVTFYYYLPTYDTLQEDVDDELKCWEDNGTTYLYRITDFDEYGQLKNNNNGAVLELLNKEFVKYSVKVKIEGIGDVNGDNLDRVFTVRYSDINAIYDDMFRHGCFYKKINGNTENQYYFRIFKKLKTQNGNDFKSDVNKVAFAQNIYGDDVAQVLFLDDVNIEGLLDHNGRPVSEIFFTILKRNVGRKEWYENKNYTGDTVEFSHCFGEVTSGIDFSGIENEPFDYNIHYLHNIKQSDIKNENVKIKGNTFSAWGETVLSGCPKTLESDINIGFEEFYGDIVEYDINAAKETVIGNVYHRFNTAQRETWAKEFRDFLHDSIVYDDYDTANGEKQKFRIDTYYLNNTKTTMDTAGKTVDDLVYCNIYPEGYFYNPHIKLYVRENDDVETTSPAKYINYTKPSLSVKKTYLLMKNDGSINVYEDEIEAKIAQTNEGGTISLQNFYYEIGFTAPVNYGFYKEDNIAFLDRESGEIIWSTISKVSGTSLTVIIDGEDLSYIDNVSEELFRPQCGDRRFYAYWSPNSTPTYAKLSEGSGRFTWRKILPPSQMMRDDELYDLPFTNGRFYIEKNVNFFLKRQDPTGKYGLSVPIFKTFKQTKSNPMTKFVIGGNNPIDFSEIMYTLNNLNSFCL